jgi:hypothetical protein
VGEDAIVTQARQNAEKFGTRFSAEYKKLADKFGLSSSSLPEEPPSRAEKESAKSEQQARREAAEKGAKTSVREGVKTTTYPYVEPARTKPLVRPGRQGAAGGGGGTGFDELMAKGGKVSASSRADGCCKRGKTRGKMY